MTSTDQETTTTTAVCCRICLSTAFESDLGQLERRLFRNLPAEATAYEELMRPCRCSGTVGVIHRGCLLLEVQYKRKVSCQMCLVEYDCVRARWRSDSVLVYLRTYPWRTTLSVLSLLTMATLSALVVYKAKAQGEWRGRMLRTGSNGTTTTTTTTSSSGRYRLARRISSKSTTATTLASLDAPPRHLLSVIWWDEPMWLSMLLQSFLEVLVPNLAVLLLFHWACQQLNHFRAWTFRNQPELVIELVNHQHAAQ